MKYVHHPYHDPLSDVPDDMDGVHISSITATAYDQHIDNSADIAYCNHVYNTPSNPDSEFASVIELKSPR